MLTKGETQFIFVDTPGLFKSTSRLGDVMVKSVYEAARGVDAAVLLCAPDKAPGKQERLLYDAVSNSGIPCILAINKVDTVKKELILETIAKYSAFAGFASIVPVSALKEDGTDILLKEVEKLLTEGEHIFGADEMTDQPERVLAGELVREKQMRRLIQEIPFGVTCETESFTEREDGILEIGVLIICEKASHKNIKIGKQGSFLKTVGTHAREDMESLFGAKVFLTMWVKDKNDWKNNAAFISEMGIFTTQ